MQSSQPIMEKQQFLILLLITFIGYVGTSIAYPIFPALFLHSQHISIIPQDWNEDYNSIFLGIALALYPLGQFIGSPIIGGFSDYYSRKNVLLISLAGSCLSYLLSAIAIQFNMLWLLLLSRFLTGFMEGNLAIIRAMAADLKHISRFKSLGRINSVASVGYIMGPLIGGILASNSLVSWFSYSTPFIFAAIFCGFTVVLTIFKIGKSYESPKYRSSVCQQLNLIVQFRILFKDKQIKHIIIVSSVFTLAVDIFYEFGPVYLTEYFAATPASIAAFISFLSITLAIGSMLPHLLSSFYSTKLLTKGAILISSVIFGLIVIPSSMVIVFVLFGLIGFSIGTGTTILTIQLSDIAKAQGQALGAQISLRMLGNAVICLIGGAMVLISLAAPIVIAGIIGLIALILCIQGENRS